MKIIKLYGENYLYKKINVDELKIKSNLLNNFYKSILNSALIHVNINQKTFFYDDNRFPFSDDMIMSNNISTLWLITIDTKEDLEKIIILSKNYINKYLNLKILIKIKSLYLQAPMIILKRRIKFTCSART